MIRAAGWLITLYGAAHTLLALTVEGAARHAGAWFSGELWGESLAGIGPAGAAYWYSLGSGGVPLLAIGLTVLWLARRGSTPPPFLGGILAVWTGVDAVVDPLTPWPVLLLAAILLLVGSVRARQRAG